MERLWAAAYVVYDLFILQIEWAAGNLVAEAGGELSIAERQSDAIQHRRDHAICGRAVEQPPNWRLFYPGIAGWQSLAGTLAAQLCLRRLFLQRQDGDFARGGVRHQSVRERQI